MIQLNQLQRILTVRYVTANFEASGPLGDIWAKNTRQSLNLFEQVVIKLKRILLFTLLSVILELGILRFCWRFCSRVLFYALCVDS